LTGSGRLQLGTGRRATRGGPICPTRMPERRRPHCGSARSGCRPI